MFGTLVGALTTPKESMYELTHANQGGSLISEIPQLEIIVLVGSYLPGYKAGGAIRSIANLVANLGKEFRFKVITSDRDLGEAQPYAEVKPGQWLKVGNAEVMYLKPGWTGLLRLARTLRHTSPDAVLYLNSFFSRRYSMLPICLWRIGACKAKSVILAPRGEFSPGALNLKRKRKSFYLKIANTLGVYRSVIWHASTSLEEADIRRSFPTLNLEALPIEAVGLCNEEQSDVIARAKDMPLVSDTALRPRSPKNRGQLKIVFLSRISPKKNLLFALNAVRSLVGEISFDLYGPIEDDKYWSECRKLIESMPNNISVRYMGVVEHAKVKDVLAGYDLFFFPTLGENYGHVICEALTAGCPVLISDDTPWRHLEDHGAGWDISLSEFEKFRERLQHCVNADSASYDLFVSRAIEYGLLAASDPETADDHRRMFGYAARDSAALNYK